MRPIDVTGPRPARGRVAVLGDVAGHTHRLRRVLENLGVTFDDLHPRHSATGDDWVTTSIVWPADLTVVQVGDLIHRGPDSPGAITLANRLLHAGCWVQVAGNHEQLYLGRPMFGWNETLPTDSADVLAHWWETGAMTVAAVITTPDGDWLATHAGLTHGFWTHVLHQTDTALGVARGIRGLVEQRDPVVWHPGAMLTGDVNYNAGPAWAEAAYEVYASWADAGVSPEFHQVHGHSSAFDWWRNTWQTPEQVRPLLRADSGIRHVTATVGTQQLVGIDPSHQRRPSRVWEPLLLQEAAVVT